LRALPYLDGDPLCSSWEKRDGEEGAEAGAVVGLEVGNGEDVEVGAPPTSCAALP